MARSLEPDIAALRRCEAAPDSEETREALRKYLGSKINLLAERAAKIVAEHRISPLTDSLVTAYDRFLENPLKTDPGCAAKTAICTALRMADYADTAFFERGIEYTQVEPCYGGAEDRAAQLRAESALALVQLGASGLMLRLVDLLFDPEKTARAGAVRAIALADRSESELLLRMKAYQGDSAPELLGEVFTGLLKVAPDRSVGLVAGFLKNPQEEVACEAALALGESRRAEAAELLWQRWESVGPNQLGRMLLIAMALSRQAAPIERLFELARSENSKVAEAAVEALRHAPNQPEVQSRLAGTSQRSGRRM